MRFYLAPTLSFCLQGHSCLVGGSHCHVWHPTRGARPPHSAAAALQKAAPEPPSKPARQGGRSEGGWRGAEGSGGEITSRGPAAPSGSESILKP